MPLRKEVESAVRHLRVRLEGALPDRIQEMRVFGSEARGEATEDSDIDVFIMVDKRDSDTDATILRTVSEVYIELNYEPFMVPLIMSREQFHDLRDRERLLARDIESQGVPV